MVPSFAGVLFFHSRLAALSSFFQFPPTYGANALASATSLALLASTAFWWSTLALGAMIDKTRSTSRHRPLSQMSRKRRFAQAHEIVPVDEAKADRHEDTQREGGTRDKEIERDRRKTGETERDKGTQRHRVVCETELAVPACSPAYCPCTGDFCGGPPLP